jgi:hypothetical protein
MHQAFKAGINISAGVGIGAFMALRMDDIMYTQVRRNVVVPFQILVNSQRIQQKDLIELGEGTKNLVYQMKPHALNKVSAKQLLVDDQDFSTPQDHYFSFLSQRASLSEEHRQKREEQVLESLDLGSYIKEEGRQAIMDLTAPKHEPTPEELLFSSGTGVPKHSKKDYEYLGRFTVKELFEQATGDKKRVAVLEAEDDAYANMMKIELKKEKQRVRRQKASDASAAKNAIMKVSKKVKKPKKARPSAATSEEAIAEIQSLDPNDDRSTASYEQRVQEIVEKQSMKASDLDKNDIDHLNFLKEKASSTPDEPVKLKTKVMISGVNQGSDIFEIEQNYE